MKEPMNTKTFNSMKELEKSRWLSFMYAIEVLSIECDKRKVSYDSVCASPIPIKHFINLRAKKFQENVIRYENSEN